MKLTLPTSFPARAIGPTVFGVTGFLCLALSLWTASAIERFSKLGVRRALTEAGHSWVHVEADGLQVILAGTAPTEAMRFRALSIAGNVVDSTRLRDQMAVADRDKIAAPDFSIEVLRNDDGISLIGLAPTSMNRTALVSTLDGLAEGDQVADMLETSDHPAPEGWDSAVTFAEAALKLLPRAKVSVGAGRVAVTAISDSPEQKASFESALHRLAPRGLKLSLDISAPRPVITPFTLRFLIDAQGARFDACSADSDRARAAILAAATAAGAPKDADCRVGLGVPTPDWSRAVTMTLGAMSEMGNGSVTFSDADIALIAGPDVPQATFDRVVGDLESNLPDVFSLKASQTAKAEGGGQSGPVEFTATLSDKGQVDLVGRIGDDLTRQAVESFARSRFGGDAVHAAMRLDSGLPEGWPTRVMVALEALSTLHSGKAVIHAADLSVEGVSGARQTSDEISRILASKLGSGGKYALLIRYDKALDASLGLPSGPECVTQLNAILSASKITFEPGSAIIDPSANPTLDKLAGVMKKCDGHQMEVGGHTDSQGREEMNLALSDQRARAVIMALQSRRVLTGGLSARGYGETVPVMANDTEENREKNRRIEFRLLEDAPTAGPDAGAAPDAASPAAQAAAQALDALGAGEDGPPLDGTDAPLDGGGDAAAAVTVTTPGKDEPRPARRPAR